jgi:hypothetical protein
MYSFKYNVEDTNDLQHSSVFEANQFVAQVRIFTSELTFIYFIQLFLSSETFLSSSVLTVVAFVVVVNFSCSPSF